MPHVFDHTPTSQEVFNASCVFFATSAGPSVVGDMCRYRFGDRCCAAGYFIPDDKYDPRMDSMSEMPGYEICSGGNALPNLLKHFGDTLPSWFRAHANLLKALQVVHDEHDNWIADQWNYRALAEHLRILANRLNLDPTAIEQVDERAKFPAGWNVVEV